MAYIFENYIPLYSKGSNKRAETVTLHFQIPAQHGLIRYLHGTVSSEARSAEAGDFFLKIQTFGTKSFFITSFQQWNLKIKVVHFNAWNNGEFASFTLFVLYRKIGKSIWTRLLEARAY